VSMAVDLVTNDEIAAAATAAVAAATATPAAAVNASLNDVPVTLPFKPFSIYDLEQSTVAAVIFFLLCFSQVMTLLFCFWSLQLRASMRYTSRVVTNQAGCQLRTVAWVTCAQWK
jgi:hypothetical protein